MLLLEHHQPTLFQKFSANSWEKLLSSLRLFGWRVCVFKKNWISDKKKILPQLSHSHFTSIPFEIKCSTFAQLSVYNGHFLILDLWLRVQPWKPSTLGFDSQLCSLVKNDHKLVTQPCYASVSSLVNADTMRYNWKDSYKRFKSIPVHKKLFYKWLLLLF